MTVDKQKLIIIGVAAVLIIFLLVFLFKSNTKVASYQELIDAKQEIIEGLKRERGLYEDLQAEKDTQIIQHLANADTYKRLLEANQINHANNQRRYNEIPETIKRLGRNTDSIRRAFADF